MRIGVQLNGVIRDYKGGLERSYMDNSGVYEISYDSYNPNDINEVFKTFNFESEEQELVFENDVDDDAEIKEVKNVKVTQNEGYKRFVADYGHEIYAKVVRKKYPNVFTDLNNFFRSFKDGTSVEIFSDENDLSIGYTMLFLSTNGCRIRRFFFENIDLDKIWNRYDLIVTDDPRLVKNKPNDKDIILINAEYNKDVEVECSVNNFNEIIDILNDETR